MVVLCKAHIPEREIDKAYHELPHQNDLEILAPLLIFCDLKKVLYRRYYKAQSE